ncbi:DUF742 domain-containing protein [Mangrovihabitans endophyticus]|uniref:DUF742 domain-containing protein n=1 Tax=Mangrovihabitans endophyticus TaxID=1751298 RepID=A0A8J3FRC9_9ACTN|nr:DUF742 domain-containing protein [Mangrovihabitans endophyticus]GGL05524.1 hypothetical protein GCM10012284_44950 [Mangrovihabitans endophyticus]
MTPPAGSDEPGRPATPGVRPFLHRSGAAAYRPQPPAGPDDQVPDGHISGLRPFVITSGRVDGVDPDIGMETQVTVHPDARPARLPPEQRAIVALCIEPHSVAEISALLKLHLGVARILVSDLRACGQLDVHVLDSEFPDPETIMRVIRGLRSIN